MEKRKCHENVHLVIYKFDIKGSLYNFQFLGNCVRNGKTREKRDTIYYYVHKIILGIFQCIPLLLYGDSDAINIKILNAGAWARSSERVSVTLPMELEDYIPQVEEFYRLKHSGRKLQWHHLMSNGIVSFPFYYRTWVK